MREAFRGQPDNDAMLVRACGASSTCVESITPAPLPALKIPQHQVSYITQTRLLYPKRSRESKPMVDTVGDNEAGSGVLVRRINCTTLYKQCYARDVCVYGHHI